MCIRWTYAACIRLQCHANGKRKKNTHEQHQNICEEAYNEIHTNWYQFLDFEWLCICTSVFVSVWMLEKVKGRAIVIRECMADVWFFIEYIQLTDNLNEYMYIFIGTHHPAPAPAPLSITLLCIWMTLNKMILLKRIRAPEFHLPRINKMLPLLYRVAPAAASPFH